MKKLLGLAAAIASIASLTACNTDQTGPSGLKKDGDSFVVATITSVEGQKEVKMYADDLYERFLSTSAGQQKVYDRIRREIIIEGFKANDYFGQDSYKVILEKKNTKKDSLVKEYKDKHKDKYQEELDKLVAENGAKDLDDYVINYILIDEVIALLDAKYKDDYTKGTNWDKDNPTWQLTAMQEKELEDYLNLYNPLDISHILVKSGGTIANPELSEEQGKKFAQVCEALFEKKTTFAQIARTYSDDEGSGKKGGHLGLMDVNTSFVNEFKHNVYQYVNGGITADWNNTGAPAPLVYRDANFKKADTWAAETSLNTATCRNLGDTTLINADERNALYYGLFGDLRIGKKYLRDTNEEYLITRSEHGVHFIKVNNKAEWEDNVTAKQNTANIISKIKEELSNKDKVKDSDFTYSAKDLLKSYRDKYAQDYYWNLFVNGKVGKVNMHGTTEFNYAKNKVAIDTANIKIGGKNINSFFGDQYNNTRTATFEQEKLNYWKSIIAWSDTLNSDGFLYGYNKKTTNEEIAYKNPYNTTKITELKNAVVGKMPTSYNV